MGTNADLADIFGDMDLDFENFHFFDFLDAKFSDFQVPDLQISKNLAWARLGPGLGKAGLDHSLPVPFLAFESLSHLQFSTCCHLQAPPASRYSRL